MEDMSIIEFAQKNGMSITEFAQKKGMSRTAVKMRLANRKIKPIGFIGATGIYAEEALNSILEPLPKGTASPKWGKNRNNAQEPEKEE